jgi:hypothetical protein
MSRRIVQTLQRTLRTFKLPPIQATIHHHLSVKHRYGPTSIISARQYAVPGPRGIPVKEEDMKEHKLTPEEKERNLLRKQAQYSSNVH